MVSKRIAAVLHVEEHELGAGLLDDMADAGRDELPDIVAEQKAGLGEQRCRVPRS